MTMDLKKHHTLWIHPFLFGLYPVLALYVFNRHEIVFPAIQQAVLTSLMVTVLVVLFFLLLFRSWQRAALAATLTLFLFLFYGHVFDLVKSMPSLGERIGHHRFLFPVWMLLLIVGHILLARIKNVDGLNRTLNLISIVLMAMLALQVAGTLVQSAVAEQRFARSASAEQDNPAVKNVDRDVYYIVLDAYSRSDLLQEQLDLDTSAFLSQLEELGFYLPECAQSNYDNTLLSLASSLNLDYLDALGMDHRVDKAVLGSSIQKNLLMQRFTALGYETFSFKSLYPELDLPATTHYYDYFKDLSVLDSQASLNFQYLFLRTTIARPLIQLLESKQEITLAPALSMWLPVANTLNSRDFRQYQQNLFALDSLQSIPGQPGRKFVYAHLFVTHQPYVFYPDGRFHPFLSQDSNGYRDQILFMNTRLLEIVRTILAKSSPPPIIVIQADHSYFEGADRVKILNAYYLPEGAEKGLYPTITPVNTFRHIFNAYFGAEYEILPDVSRYVDDQQALREVPFTCVDAP